MRQFYPKHRPLETVQPGVDPYPFVIVTFLRAMHTKGSQTFGGRIVIRRHEAAIAHPTQVLRRIERETSNHAHCTCSLSVLFSSDRLCRVFHYRDRVFLIDSVQPLHFGTLPVKM